MEDTLRGLVKKGAASRDDLFNAETQDNLAITLMREKGLDDWESGHMTSEQFGTNLAKVWASLPVLTNTYDAKGRPVGPGDAYYGGVGPNPSRSKQSPNDFAAVLGEPGAPVISSQNSGTSYSGGQQGKPNNRLGGDTDRRMREQVALPQLDPTRHMEPWERPDYEPNPRGYGENGGGSDEGGIGGDAPGLPDVDYRTRTGPGGGPTIHPGWGQAFKDEVSDSFIVRGMQYEMEADGFEWDKNFNPVDRAIEQGYDNWRYFSEARNAAHFKQLEKNYKAEQKRKRRQAVNPYLSAELVGGLMNPDTLASMVLPGGVGVSAMRSGMANAARTTLKASMLAGGSEVAIEAARRKFDPMATYDESLMRIGATAALGGVLGGGIGAMATRGARRNLVKDTMREIAEAKGIYTVTEEVDLGKGRKGKVTVGQIPNNAPEAAKRSGVRVVGDQVIVDDKILIDRFMRGDHKTDAANPNELLEYEVQKAASMWRKLGDRMNKPGAVPTMHSNPIFGAADEGGGASRPLYSVDDRGQITVDQKAVRAKYDAQEPIVVGGEGNTKPIQIDSRTIKNADEAADIVKRAAQAASKARDQSEFEDSLQGILRASGTNFDARMTASERQKRARLEQEAEIEAAEALENYRRKNNKILQDTKLEALARLTDGPYKRLHRNGYTPEIRDLTDKLAADGAFLRGSDETGLSIGPSVYSRARTWDGVVDTLYRQETETYEKYLGFNSNPTVAGVPVNKSVRKSRADGTPSIGIQEFRRRATRAHITGTADDIPEVNEMAGNIQRAYEQYREVGERYGVLRSDEILNQRIAKLEDEIEEQVNNLETVPGWKQDFLEGLKRERDLAKQEPNEDYFTRIFDHATIRENREQFKERIVKPWMRQQPYGQYWKAGKDELGPKLREIEQYGTEQQINEMRMRYEDAPDKSQWVTEKFSTKDKAIDERAEKLIDQILEEAEPSDLATLREPNRPTFGRSRQFNIPNSMLLKDGPNGNGLADFIETDYMLVQKVYAERMGPAIEMARSFARPVDGVDAWRGFEESVEAAKDAERKAFATERVKDPEVESRVNAAKQEAMDERRAELSNREDRMDRAQGEYDAARKSFAEAKENEKLAKMSEDEQREWINEADERAQPSLEKAVEEKEFASPDDEIKFRNAYMRKVRKSAFAKVEFVRNNPSKVMDDLTGAQKAIREAGEARDNALRDMNLEESDIEDIVQAAGDEITPEMVLTREFEEHWQPIERDIMQLRDRVNNRVVRAPDRWDNRTATGLRNWSHLAYMGMSALSAIPELGTLIMRHGVGRVWQHTLANMDAAMQASVRANVDEMRKAGAILDIVQGSALSHFAETGVDAIHGSRVERWLRTGANRYFMFNGLAQMTTRLKEIDAGIRVHDMVERIDRVAMMGNGADKADLQELARWGISRADAEKMAKEPIMQMDEGHWLANTDAWGDEELVRKFRAAIAQGNENTILMATAADKPTIVDGVVWIKKGGRADKYAVRAGLESEGGYWRIQSGLMTLPFTFWSYAIAATNKIMIAGLDEPSARKLGGIGAMIGLGYMTASLKTPDYIWDNQGMGERMTDAIDQSGIMGVLSQAQGIFQQDTLGGAALRAAGAGPSAAINFAGGAVTGDANQFSKGLPLQNHILLGDMFDAAVDGIERRQSGLD